MPLLDHFVPPLNRTHPWRGFNSAWAAAMARHLNQDTLPAGFYAIPNVELDGPVEIDVAAVRERQAEAGVSAGGAPPLWTPPQPALTLSLDFPPLDFVEVQVFWDENSPELKAAVELVSPRNKDRPDARQVFAVKCLSYLHAGSSVVVVDVVTSRRANFHAEILRLLELNGPAAWQSPTELYAVAYQAAAVEQKRQLRAWPETLAVGGPLPPLPLWLGPDLCVPLDLETTYQMTCTDLRIRPAG
jgi:hypothetical protein